MVHIFNSSHFSHFVAVKQTLHCAPSASQELKSIPHATLVKPTYVWRQLFINSVATFPRNFSVDGSKGKLTFGTYFSHTKASLTCSRAVAAQYGFRARSSWLIRDDLLIPDSVGSNIRVVILTGSNECLATYTNCDNGLHNMISFIPVDHRKRII